MISLSLGGNWVDLVIILILLYFVSEAWRHGIWIIMAEFLSFFSSLMISLWAYKFTASLLRANFSLANSVSKALGFLLTAVIIEAVLSRLFIFLISKIPRQVLKHKISKLLGIIPALGEGIILISFILILLLGLPIRPRIKGEISDSKIGGFIVSKTSGIEKNINEVFGGVINDSLTNFTIKSGSRERVPLMVEKQEFRVDTVSEAEMFRLVNEERRKRGIQKLVWAEDIVTVARAQARDMWERKYFSHYSLEGKDVGNRLNDVGIKYGVAGENLALAPTLLTAHNGLMNSEGHRKNILSRDFRKVGIGVVDYGRNGKIFVQVFID